MIFYGQDFRKDLAGDCSAPWQSSHRGHWWYSASGCAGLEGPRQLYSPICLGPWGDDCGLDAPRWDWDQRHVASPDNSLGYLVSLCSYSGSQRLFQEPKAEGAGLQMAHYWLSQNLISPAISASGKSSQSSSDSREDTILQWEKQHRFCNYLLSTMGVNGSSVSAQPLGDKPLGEPEAMGGLLPLCTLLRARNLLSKSGPIFFF